MSFQAQVNRELRVDEKLHGNVPFIYFNDLAQHNQALRPEQGYGPLCVEAKLFKPTPGIARPALKLEVAQDLLPFDIEGLKSNPKGGRVLLHSPSTVPSPQFSVQTDLVWTDTGIVLLGDSNVISGTLLRAARSSEGKYRFHVRADASTLLKPYFRLRRAYDTAGADNIGTGNSTDKEFEATLANAPICPGSLKITFVHGSGTKTQLIRDDGRGKLTNLPPELFLEGNENTINYQTGEVKLKFNDQFIPTGSIDAVYEEDSNQVADFSEWFITMKYEEY